ncbi:inter-alpha-trypsin inhibitor heavy chain H3-like [Brachionichthys hirsutus]|uniref:inter-alpha-trypsin inhibitor heavy chain H3-like n=1 Tax=Brachionichthys hirsutus TaxID=412623 RepID=UPI0036046870
MLCFGNNGRQSRRERAGVSNKAAEARLSRAGGVMLNEEQPERGIQNSPSATLNRLMAPPAVQNEALETKQASKEAKESENVAEKYSAMTVGKNSDTNVAELSSAFGAVPAHKPVKKVTIGISRASAPRSHSQSNRGSSKHRASTFKSVADVDGDPHFIIELPERDDALCFNINDKPGTIFNLVRDPKSGLVVNGQIIDKKKFHPDANVNTYFGRFGISHEKLGVRLEVSTEEITAFHDGKKFKLLWSDSTSIKEANLDLSLTRNCCLTVTLRHSVKFEVIRHTKVWKRRQVRQDYLGFYTLDSHHLSASVHGLLGQFYHGVEFEVTGQKDSNATMYVKQQILNVTRYWQKDFSRNVTDGEKIQCWFAGKNGTGLIDGRASDYIVSGLF